MSKAEAKAKAGAEAAEAAEANLARIRYVIDRLVPQAPAEPACAAAASALLLRWLRHADRGIWRDSTGLSIATTAVADDTKAFLEARTDSDATPK